MSEPVELNLDLEKAFLPAWAQEPSASRYSDYQGEDNSRSNRGGFGSNARRGGGAGGAGGGGRPPRQDGGSGGFRGQGAGDRGPRSAPGGASGFRSGPRPGGGSAGGGGRPGQSGPSLKWDPASGERRPDGRPGQRPPFRDRRPEPLIPVEVQITPLPGGVQSLVRQIRLSGRAYPLFEVAGLVIQKPDRYEVILRVQKGKDGKALQPLFVCSLDDTLWLSEAEAARHSLKAHFDTFYQTNKIECNPPKGTYTFVAQCGMSGEVLGPPNYHGYQDRLRQLHSERYSRLPFEAYKARVRIVKDEAVVKEWIDSQSFKFEYTTLNVPEPQTLANRDEVDIHFREVHLPNLVKSVEAYPLKRESQPRLPGPLQTLLRVALDKEQRFPIRTATALSTAFAHSGLQFFKRDKTIVHVCVARPHFLDLETQVVSDGVKSIIAYLEAHPNTNRKTLVDALAPMPEASTPEATPLVTPAAPASTSTDTAEAVSSEPSAEGQTPPSDSASPSQPAAPIEPTTSPERSALLSNLHWLVHQGHVIEFASGVMELAKRPVQTPPSPKHAGNAGQPREAGPRKERGPRPDRTPWSRKNGLLLVNTQAIQPYGVASALIGL